VSSFYLQLLIWVVAVGVVFGLLWKGGYLDRFGRYVGETREELRKCSWPSRDELRDTTVLVLFTIGILAVFLLVVDASLLKAVRFLVR
jgi:preprotein translocase subunit SecE